MKRIWKSLFLTAVLLAAVLTPLSADAYALNDRNKPLSREILTEGMVLLKNEADALPLASTDRIAVFGSACVYTGKTTSGFQIGGGGSSELTPSYTPVDLLSALEAAENAGEISVYKPLTEAYRKNAGYVPDDAMYAAARASTDKAVMILSRYSTEGGDRKAEKGDWYLSDAEAEMLTKLSSLYDSVIVLINAGGAIDTSWTVGKADGIDVEAVLYVWYPGAEGGNAIADLLLGKANPCGKLTMTLAETLADYPSDDGFDNRDYTDYTEDIYVGYRYFTTFDKNVNYPFGFGLSYTTFSFTDAAYTADETTVTVRVTVTNTGEMAGKEVVQVYYGAPRIADGSKLGNPKAELAGFAKTTLLAAGESETVSISFPIASMASFDDTGATGAENKSAYVLEKGDYKLYVGNSVTNALSNPCGTYTVAETTKTRQLHAYCAPTDLEKRLRDDGSYEDLSGLAVSDTAHKPQTAESAVRTTPESVITGRDVLAGKATLDEFLAQMSEAELVSFMVGHDGRVDNCTGAIGGSRAVNNKYILPELQSADGPGGLRLGRKATGWGCETLIGCTWNPELAEQMGEGIAEEALISYIDVWLAPGINLHRHPLCGRNFEYYSEDPLLSGNMAAAAVKGAQNKGIYAAIKHFVANEKEENRSQNDSRVSERALRELYLKPFEICIQEASPRFVMSSYNYLNGYESAERYDLLTGILREEFGFDGVVLTDWYNDSDPVKELRAGINVKMPIGDESKLKAAVSSGEITRAELISAVKPTVKAILDSRKTAEISSQVIRADGETGIPAENCYRTDGTVYRNDFLMLIGHYDTRNHFIPCLLHYFIKVEKAGYYNLSFMALNESGRSHNDCVDVFVDGKRCQNLVYNNEYISGDYAFTKRECGVVYLPEGEHTLTVKIKNYFGRLDGLVFEPTQKPAVDPLSLATLSYVCREEYSGTLPDSYTGTVGETVTLPTESLKRSGYTFDGWTDGSTVYAPGAAMVLVCDTELAAAWTAHEVTSYAFTFVSGKSYTGALPENALSDTQTLVIPACTAVKEGYTLYGFTDGNRIYKTGDTVRASEEYTALQAVWLPANAAMSVLRLADARTDFDNTGFYASGSSTVRLTTDPENPDAYAYYVKSHNGAFYSAFSYRNTKAGYPLKAGHTYDIAVEYFVTGINKNGVETMTETNASVFVNIEYAGKPHLVVSDAAAAGQWRTMTTAITVDKNFTPSDSDTITLYINPDTAQASGYNYYITQFDVIDRTATVSFASEESVSGGSLPATIEAAKNSEITLPETDITRGGYYFNGWTDGQAVYQPGETYTVTENVTFYAVWKAGGVVLAFHPGDSLTDVLTFSYAAPTVTENPDLASEKVFYTDNGLLIFNTHGRIAMESGHTYKLSLDVRPDETRGFALFCHKDKTASPETFVYTGIGSAAADVWTELSATFTLDGYNNVPGNTLQLQIQGANTPYYFRNFTLTDLTPPTAYEVCFESDGTYRGSLPEAQSVKRGESLILPDCTAKRPGYVFDGWKIGSAYYEAGSTFTPSANIAAQAVWLRQSVVFALRPGRSYPEVKTFSMIPLGTDKNPDNTAETVFRTENGVYIENTNGLLSLQKGGTYRLSFDIRPDNDVSLALFCHKDKSASPESFVYQGIGKASAGAWTSIATTFTLDSFKNVPGNTLQIQISGANTPYYIRNIVLEGIPDYTVTYADADGNVTEIVDLYGAVTTYQPEEALLGSKLYTVTVDGETKIFSVDTPLRLAEKNTVITAYLPHEPQISDKNSIRATSPAGIRFAAFIDGKGHMSAEEYGFLVARADLYALAGTDPEADLKVTVNADTQEQTFSGVTAGGFRYVGGRNYRSTSTDNKTVFAENGETPFGSYGTDGFYFTAVITGLDRPYTVEETTYVMRYRVPFVARSYVKIAGVYFYGDCRTASMETVAVRLLDDPNATSEDKKIAQEIVDRANETT